MDLKKCHAVYVDNRVQVPRCATRDSIFPHGHALDESAELIDNIKQFCEAFAEGKQAPKVFMPQSNSESFLPFLFYFFLIFFFFFFLFIVDSEFFLVAFEFRKSTLANMPVCTHADLFAHILPPY